MWRSLLFVPILNDRLVAGAPRRGADAIVLDLEASVPLDRKSEAQGIVAKIVSTLKRTDCEVTVRVNALSNGGDGDIAVAVEAGADVIVLPHATPEGVTAAADIAGKTPLIPLIESPRGVIDALAIAEAAPSTVALGLGVEDYAAEMGAPPTPDLLVPAAFQVIQAARATGRMPLIVPDTIADYSDVSRFEAAARRARRMGAAGGFAIHPRQVEILNQVFTPTPEEHREAEEIVQAAEQACQSGDGIATLDGRMIDAPVEARARNVLAMRKRFAK
ncbi:MAG: CoA ester lyase [Pseudomonadota bacterium]